MENGAARAFDAEFDALLDDARVRVLAELAAPAPIFVVGGSLRDAALGRPAKDLDVVTVRDGERLARAYAGARGARLVRLGGERFAAWRLVEGDAWVDLWDLDGGEIAADLRRRDFTVNAMAVALPSRQLIDPCGGQADLERRRLAANGPHVFVEDPLRVLRLVRLALSLPAFAVEPRTLALARASAAALAGVPAERARAELELVLGAGDVSAIARWLADLGIETFVLGEGFPLPPDAAAAPDSATRPAESIWAHLAMLRHRDADRAAVAIRDAARRGLLTTGVARRVTALLEPDWSPPEDEVARRRWIHAAGRGWREALALRLELAADQKLREGWRAAAAALSALGAEEAEALVAPPALVTGDEIQVLLGIGAGPEVGEAVAALRRAQVDGAVRNRSEAEAFLLEKKKRSWR